MNCSIREKKKPKEGKCKECRQRRRIRSFLLFFLPVSLFSASIHDPAFHHSLSSSPAARDHPDLWKPPPPPLLSNTPGPVYAASASAVSGGGGSDRKDQRAERRDREIREIIRRIESDLSCEQRGGQSKMSEQGTSFRPQHTHVHSRTHTRTHSHSEQIVVLPHEWGAGLLL